MVELVAVLLVAGFVGRALSRSKPRLGLALTALLGALGLLAVTLLGRFLGVYGPTEKAGFIGAAIGALLLLEVWSLFRRAA